MTKSAIEKHLEWLEYKELCEISIPWRMAYQKCIEDARLLLAEEQAQKPTAQAGLVEALDECARVLYAIMPIVPTKDNPNVPAAVENAYKQARKALSRYRHAPSSDDGLWEELNDLYKKSLYHPGLCLNVMGAYDVKDLLDKYRHPSTAKSADRCAEMVERLRAWHGRIPYKMRDDRWTEFYAILSEFSKDADGKDVR